MNIELQRSSQLEITTYSEVELEVVRREIALEQSGVDPKLAIEHLMIAKFGSDYRYDELTDDQRTLLGDITLEAFSRHIENSNHRIDDDTLRAQVLLMWAKVCRQDVDSTADMFSIPNDEIDGHALEGLRYVCDQMPFIPEQRFKKAKPILAGIRMQTAEVTPIEASAEAPEVTPTELQANPIGNIAVAQEITTAAQAEVATDQHPQNDQEKIDYRKYLLVAGVSPDKSLHRPPQHHTEDVVLLAPEQLKSIDYERFLLKRISSHRILEREEVTELSKDIEAGLVAKHILENMPSPSSEAEGALYNDLQTLATIGEAAKDKLVRHNLRLVMHIASWYAKNTERLSFSDLFNEGVLGLMHAVKKYDYKKGFTISTYATPWIHQAIQKSIETSDRLIYLPARMHAMRRKIAKAGSQYQEEFGTLPSDEELAEYMDIPLDEFALVKQAASRLLSLNFPTGEKENKEFGDLLVNTDEKMTEDVALELTLPSRQALGDIIVEHVAGIAGNPEAAQALMLYYGLPLHKDIFDQTFASQHDIEPGAYHTLEVIGTMFGVSRETIRKRLKLAKKILAQPHLADLLRDITAK